MEGGGGEGGGLRQDSLLPSRQTDGMEDGKTDIHKHIQSDRRSLHKRINKPKENHTNTNTHIYGALYNISI